MGFLLLVSCENHSFLVGHKVHRPNWPGQSFLAEQHVCSTDPPRQTSMNLPAQNPLKSLPDPARTTRKAIVIKPQDVGSSGCTSGMGLHRAFESSKAHTALGGQLNAKKDGQRQTPRLSRFNLSRLPRGYLRPPARLIAATVAAVTGTRWRPQAPRTLGRISVQRDRSAVVLYIPRNHSGNAFVRLDRANIASRPRYPRYAARSRIPAVDPFDNGAMSRRNNRQADIDPPAKKMFWISIINSAISRLLTNPVERRCLVVLFQRDPQDTRQCTPRLPVHDSRHPLHRHPAALHAVRCGAHTFARRQPLSSPPIPPGSSPHRRLPVA